MSDPMDELNEIARHEIRPGWDVFTADDELLGTVDQVSDVSFTVANTSGAGNMLEMTFEDVESAGDGRVNLALERDEIQTGIDAT
jgi:hypothetical protein